MKTENTDAPKVTGHLLLFRNTEWDHGSVPPEQFPQVMERVRAWFDDLERQGQIAGAQPLLDGGKVVVKKNGRTVIDGPFAEAKEAIGGYVLLKTLSMEEALAIAQSNPMLDYGLIVEVRPTSDMCPSTQRALQSFANAAA
jgi:hypothetical protein